MGFYASPEKHIGKRIAKAELVNDGEQFRLTFIDGADATYSVEGDCCSRSWIEHLEQPAGLEGATITAVEDGGGVPWDGHECRKTDPTKWANDCGHDSLSVYNTIFRTDKGDVVLEYRNDSNGYYGGYLVELG